MPLGVGVEDTYKCNWCEFKEGCEWRDEKAGEVLRRNWATRKVA